MWGILFAILLLVSLVFFGVRIAKEKGWALPAYATALVAGATVLVRPAG